MSGPRFAAALAVVLAVTACSATPDSAPARSEPATAPLEFAAARFEVSPPADPGRALRGEMTQDVVVVDGHLSMFFELRNVGDEPLTFINTLYDTEPDQLYTPVVTMGWQEGGNAVYTRSGRFFPSPAIVQPGETAVFIMGGQPVRGSGTLGELNTNMKDCPTRGMDDVPSAAVAVEELTWEVEADGSTVVRGELVELDGSRRPTPPTIGVAFFTEAGNFAGAVVDHGVDGPLGPHERRPFEITGPGVGGEAAVARGYAFIG